MRQSSSLLLALASCSITAALSADDLRMGAFADLAQLQAHGIAPDVAGVRLFLQPPGPSEEDVRLARLWAAQLGSEKFAEREAAAEKLLAMGLDALAAVEQASQSQDVETRARARGILARLTRLKEKHDATLPAVFRTIVRERLKGLAPQVLKAAPYAVGYAAEDCLCRALWTTVTPEDAALLRKTIATGAPAARVAATLALPAAAGDAARDDLLALLQHQDAPTRLAAAQALAPLARSESFRALITGLGSDDLAVRSRAAQILERLTGQHFNFAPYADAERRRLAVARWEEWLAGPGSEAPLRQPLAETPMPWGRILMCHIDPFSVTETDHADRIWFRRQSAVAEDEAYCGCAVSPEGYRVLAGFGFVVALQGDGPGREVWRLVMPEQPASLDRTPAGTYLLGLFDDQELREVKPNGEIVRQMKLPGAPSDLRALDNGRVLAALYSTRQIVEIDRQGDIVWKIDNVPPPESARRLTNGNTLTTTALGKAIEYAPNGDVVWSYAQSIPLAYDAVELPNGNVLIAYRRGVREIDRTGLIVHEWRTPTVRRLCVY